MSYQVHCPFCKENGYACQAHRSCAPELASHLEELDIERDIIASLTAERDSLRVELEGWKRVAKMDNHEHCRHRDDVMAGEVVRLMSDNARLREALQKIDDSVGCDAIGCRCHYWSGLVLGREPIGVHETAWRAALATDKPEEG